MSLQKRLILAILSLALPVSLGAFSMDMVLPVLPEMAKALSLTPGQIQWILNLFVLSFALCHLLVNSMVDRMGVYFLFVAAVIGYVASSAGIGFSSSYALILFLRVVQALAACTTLVLSMALITQTFHSSYITKGHTILSGVTSLGPLLAPIAGAAVITAGGSWRSIFFALGLAGCAILVLFIRGKVFRWNAEETAPQRGYGKIATSPYFWRYATYASTGMWWIFIFFSSMPFIVYSIYNRGVWALSLVFLAASVCFLTGGFLGSYFHRRIPQGRLFDWCIVIQLMLSAVLLLTALTLPVSFSIFIGWIMLMQLNCGVYFGPSISTALQGFSESPVAATAFQGFQQYASTFLVAGGVLIVFRRTVTDLGIMLLIVTGLSACIGLFIKRRCGVEHAI